MKLALCTKFQVIWMNCFESRRGGGAIDLPPSRLRVTIFFWKAARVNICIGIVLFFIYIVRHIFFYDIFLFDSILFFLYEEYLLLLCTKINNFRKSKIAYMLSIDCCYSIVMKRFSMAETAFVQIAILSPKWP